MKYFKFSLLVFVLSLLMCFPVFADTIPCSEMSPVAVYDVGQIDHILWKPVNPSAKIYTVYVKSEDNIYFISNTAESIFVNSVSQADVDANVSYGINADSLTNCTSLNGQNLPFNFYRFIKGTAIQYSYSYTLYCDLEYDSASAFASDLMKYNSFDDYIKNNVKSEDSNHLPMLHFSLEKNHVMGFPNLLKVKETFKWDYQEHELYKNDPSKYTIEIVASTNLKKADSGIGNVFDAYTWAMNDSCKVTVTQDNIFISNNKYSFMYDDIGKTVYKKLDESWDGSTCGYYLYIRTKEFDGSMVSHWKVYKVCMGGYVQQMGISIDENGVQSTLNDEDYDIGDDTSNGDYSTDNSDDASSDPSSDLYDKTGSANASTVVAELTNIVSTLGQIPALLSMVCSWIPGNIITLISVGIGLIVVVGIVKWVL